MGEQLKREHDLIVLRFSLQDDRSGTSIRCEFQGKVNGKVKTLADWSFSPDTMGFPETLDGHSFDGRGLPLDLPKWVKEEIASRVAAEQDSDRPIWVQLVRPYGYLGLVPWERVLIPALNLPVLRLPDFLFPPPVEASDNLDVAVCASAPLNCEYGSVVTALRVTIDGILKSNARPQRMMVHVFADSDMVRVLREYGTVATWPDDTVRIHDAANALKYASEDLGSRVTDLSGQLRSPWLLWMRDALQKGCVDVVHFICHGWLSGDSGALLTAQSPIERTSRYLSGPIGVAELSTFLTQVGAWSVGFTSPEQCASEVGLRDLADCFAQTQPGPAFLHVMDDDKQGAAIPDLYRLLYSHSPERAPMSAALSISCQPYRVAAPRAATRALRGGRRTQTAKQSLENVPESAQSSLSELLTSDRSATPWVAAAERYLETSRMQIQQASPVPAGTDDTNLYRLKATLHRVEDAVAEASSEYMDSQENAE